MSLFSRRRTMTSWMPLHPEPVTLLRDAAKVADGQAYPAAFQVRFGNSSLQDPVITATTYVAAAAYSPGGPAKYRLMLHYRYTVEGYPGWAHCGITSDPLEDVWTAPDLDDAVDNAEAWAGTLAHGNLDSMGNLPEVFGWDGGVF